MAYEIFGNWSKGLAFDLHTVASTHLGVDAYGNNKFKNTRSEMGELVYQLKYQNDLSLIPRIVELILENIQGIETFDAIIPVPSSKQRTIQPVDAISQELGDQCDVPVFIGYFIKQDNIELKSIADPADREQVLMESIIVSGTQDISGKNILLVDDLYRSGATLNTCCRILNSEGVRNICVLTMTKTRSNR